MRFACGDMRDHIVSYQNDHRPSYWRRRALRQQARLRIDFSEILRVVRFSTFATISVNTGSGLYYSITSSARASSDGGTSRPSAFAALRLMTSSNLGGCSTGRLAGDAPFRILSTYSAARRPI